MKIDVPVSNDCRIDVVANGLAPWRGSQQAVAEPTCNLERCWTQLPGANGASNGRAAACPASFGCPVP